MFTGLKNCGKFANGQFNVDVDDLKNMFKHVENNVNKLDMAGESSNIESNSPLTVLEYQYAPYNVQNWKHRAMQEYLVCKDMAMKQKIEQEAGFKQGDKHYPDVKPAIEPCVNYENVYETSFNEIINTSCWSMFITSKLSTVFTEYNDKELTLILDVLLDAQDQTRNYQSTIDDIAARLGMDKDKVSVNIQKLQLQWYSFLYNKACKITQGLNKFSVDNNEYLDNLAEHELIQHIGWTFTITEEQTLCAVLPEQLVLKKYFDNGRHHFHDRLTLQALNNRMYQNNQQSPTRKYKHMAFLNGMPSAACIVSLVEYMYSQTKKEDDIKSGCYLLQHCMHAFNNLLNTKEKNKLVDKVITHQIHKYIHDGQNKIKHFCEKMPNITQSTQGICKIAMKNSKSSTMNESIEREAASKYMVDKRPNNLMSKTLVELIKSHCHPSQVQVLRHTSPDLNPFGNKKPDRIPTIDIDVELDDMQSESDRRPDWHDQVCSEMMNDIDDLQMLDDMDVLLDDY